MLANLFADEPKARRARERERKEKEKANSPVAALRKRRRRGSNGREKLLCISTNLRAGRTRRVTVARREVPTPERWFMISTKVASFSRSIFVLLLLSFFRCNLPPRSTSQSALSLRLFLSSLAPSLSFSPRSLLWFHIDEFIVDTARSIVTKIVYDIDSSFYVNPVSEWFWSTWRDEYAHFAFGRAYAIEHREERKR